MVLFSRGGSPANIAALNLFFSTAASVPHDQPSSVAVLSGSSLSVRVVMGGGSFSQI